MVKRELECKPESPDAMRSPITSAGSVDHTRDFYQSRFAAYLLMDHMDRQNSFSQL